MFSLRRSNTRHADAVDIGIQANGTRLRVPLACVSTLISGLPGSGKSSTLSSIIVGIAPLPDVALVILDPKRVTFLHCAERAVVARGASDCTKALEDLTAEMDRRYALMESHGADEWPGASIVVLVDELAELMASGEKRADEHRSILLRRLLQLGRVARITVVGATQRPSASLIDSDVRSLFGARIAHALDSPETVKMAGLDPELAPAHRIGLGASFAGLAYVALDGTRTPIYGRVWHADRDLVASTCARFAHLYRPITRVDTDPARSEALDGAGVTDAHDEAERPAQAHVAPVVPPSGAWAAPSGPAVEFDLTPGDVGDPLHLGNTTGAETSPPTAGASVGEEAVVDVFFPVTSEPSPPMSVAYRGQANEVSASARREAPSAIAVLDDLGEDAATLLEVLRRGPCKTGELQTATGLPEGRCRRARDRLAVAGAIRSTAAGWSLA